MNSTILDAGTPFFRGFGLACVVFWIAASFAPIAALLDGEDPNIVMNWVFLLTGALPFLLVYPVLMFMAKSATRRRTNRKLRKMFWPLAVYAALWITLYPIFS